MDLFQNIICFLHCNNAYTGFQPDLKSYIIIVQEVLIYIVNRTVLRDEAYHARFANCMVAYEKCSHTCRSILYMG